MAYFLKENLTGSTDMHDFVGQKSNSNGERVAMLSEKISNLKFGQKAQSQRKFQLLQKQTDQAQQELDAMINAFTNQSFTLKHLITNLSSSLSFDHNTLHTSVTQQLNQCQNQLHTLTQRHIEERKNSDARMMKFIDQKVSIVRDLIQREARQRSGRGREVQQGLSRDISEIKERLEEEKRVADANLNKIHDEFLQQYEAMQQQFTELSGKYAESEGQFYKMLRDVLKKVKAEIGDGKKARQDMEQTILILIQKICDKAMEESAL